MQRMLTLVEVAELLDRSPHAIRQLMWRGTLPSSKIGGRLYAPEDELIHFLELRKRTTAEAAVKKAA